MTEALGFFFCFNSWVSRGCLVDCYWRVVDIERAAVRGSRHGGYRLQRYGEVYSEITDGSTHHEIFKVSCGLLPRQRAKSVLQFESDRVSISRTASSPAMFRVAACGSTVTAR